MNFLLLVNTMASINGNSGFRPGLPGGSEQAKKKRVMFETMAKGKEPTPAAAGLESRLSVGATSNSSILNPTTNQSPTKR